MVGSTDTVDDFKFELGNPLKINATPTTLKENGSNYTTSTTAKALLKANKELCFEQEEYDRIMKQPQLLVDKV